MEIDDLIDGAVKSYVTQEPRDGLENRILYRVHVNGLRRSRFLRWLAVAVPVFAWAVVVVMSLGHRSEKPPITAPREQASTLDAPAIPPLAILKRTKREQSRKELVFPSAIPLTAQERALIAFATMAPKDMVASFIEQQQYDTAPITIDDIQIAPLP